MAEVKGETDLCRHRLLKYCLGQGVDLGCGNAKIKIDAIGIDLYHPDADMHADVRDLSCYPNNHFDYVYSSHMLEELQNTEATLREWLRILKPEGYLVLYQADRDLYFPLGDPRCNVAHKHHFKWEDLWVILEKFGITKLVHHATYPDSNEWSFELVVRKKPFDSKEKTKMELETAEGISFLIPTLNRPKNIEDFTLSVDGTVKDHKKIEIVFGIHEEDIASKEKIEELKSKIKIELRMEYISRYPDGKVHLTHLWNQLYTKAKYPIVGYFGDDVIFQTADWDQEVYKEFEKNKIILFYANDVHIQKGALATLFFTHKKVHDAVGYYLNNNFRRWYMDTWWDNLFRKADKIIYRPGISWAHMHPEAFPDRADDTYRAMENYKVADGEYWSSAENQKEMDRVFNIICGLK